MRRPRLIRSPFLFWLAAALLAALTGLVVSRIGAEAGALAARYGPLRPVVVAARPVEMGAELEAGDLSTAELPAVFLPEGALTDTEQAVGRTALVPLAQGQAVLTAHLSPDGLRGISALLRPGFRAVAVPAGAASAPLQRGDVVDVLATFDPALTGGGDPTFPVAVGAQVLAVDEDRATIAVAPDEALAVAYSVANGSITLALSSPLEGPIEGRAEGSGSHGGQRKPEAATAITATPTTRR